MSSGVLIWMHQVSSMSVKKKARLKSLQQHLEKKMFQRNKSRSWVWIFHPLLLLAQPPTFDRFHVVKLLNEAMDKVHAPKKSRKSFG
jgi:hypothetical protein